MADDRIDVKVGASTDELKSGMDRSKGIVKDGVAGMQTPFDAMRQTVTGGMKQMHSEVQGAVTGITATLGNIGKVAVGIGAVLAGGSLLKGTVDSFLQVNAEAKKLSVIMGLTMSDAGALALSFKRVGIDGDTATSALLMMTRQLKTNEEGFNKIGIQTRDVSGNLLPMNEIMFNSIGALKEFKEGTDRTEAAMTVFGRNVGNLPAFLKLTQQAVEDTRERMRALGIELSEGSAAKARAYKEGLHDVELVFTALKYKIGSEVIPVLIQLAQLFADIGPPAVQALGSIIKAFQTLLTNATVFVSDMKNLFAGCWDQLRIGAQAAAEAVKHALQGNFAEAAAAVATGYAAMKQASADWQEQAISDANQVRFAVMNATAAKLRVHLPIMGGEPNYSEPEVKLGGGKTYDDDKPKPRTGGGGGGGGDKSRLQEWQQELEAMKVAEKAFLDYSKQQERSYWQEKLALCKQGSEEERQVRHRVFQLGKEIAKEEVTMEISAIREKQASEKAHGKTRLQYEEEILNLLAQKYGKDSLEYRREQQNQTKMLEEEQKKRIQSEVDALNLRRQLGDLDRQMVQEEINYRQQMGRVSAAQAIAERRKLKMQELQEERRALLEERKLRAQYPEDVKKINAQILLLDKKKNLELQQLDQEYVLALKGQWDQFFSAFGSGFNSALQGIWEGTQTLGEAMSSLLQNMLSTLINMGLQWALQWVSNMLYTAIFGRITAIERVTQESGAAYAAAYAATCAIPIIGPELAPAVAAASMAGALAGGLPAASAAKGWDVDKEAITLLHPEEMVLNPEIANRIRTMTAMPAAPGRGIQINKLNFAPTLVMKQPMTHAYAEEITRKYLLPAFQNELDRFGVNLGRS